MVRKQLWEEIRKLREQQGAAILGLARQYELDRKTVRRCVRQHKWEPYRRQVPVERILGEHEEYLLKRAPMEGYSARILYQELVANRGVSGELRHGKAFCSAPQAASGAGGVDAGAVRDASGIAEPPNFHSA